jgi:predicted 2-oxoglutarate/Fe(II)-dependent dioxygenase YbiX
LEAHFGVTLSGCQLPSFLAYGKGDFYLAHRDNSDDPGAPEMSRERQISVIVFLNSQSEEPQEDSYGGGSLTFYGLMADPRAASWGFPLVGKPGLLIAFRSNLLHEVTPVTHGERYTIATWFF